MAKFGQDWDDLEPCRAKRSVYWDAKKKQFSLPGTEPWHNVNKSDKRFELIQHGSIWVSAT